jgi:hypothetical protein
MEENKIQPLAKVVDILMDYWKKKGKRNEAKYRYDLLKLKN